MIEFKPRISEFKSGCSTNCATTTAQDKNNFPVTNFPADRSLSINFAWLGLKNEVFVMDHLVF